MPADHTSAKSGNSRDLWPGSRPAPANDRGGGVHRDNDTVHGRRSRARPSGARPEASFSAHYAQILRYVRSVVRNADEAQELTQETFLRAYRAQHSLRDPDAMLPWLYSVATHVCLDRLRQRTRQARARSDLDPEAISPTGPESSPGRGVEREDMSTCVQPCVSELSNSYRAVYCSWATSRDWQPRDRRAAR